jgi:sigma-B regulation protein RsbU (phosphoserine phosphatase)
VGKLGKGKAGKPPAAKLPTAKLLPEAVRRLLPIADPHDLLHEVCALANDAFGTQEVSLLLYREAENALVEHEVVGKGLRPKRHRVYLAERSLCAWVAANRKPVVVPDVRKDKRYLEVRPETRSEAAVPILAGDRLLGVINFESPKLGYFKPALLPGLEILAAQLAAGLRLAELAERAQEWQDRLAALHNISRLVGGVAPLPTLLQRAADAVRMTCGGHYAAVFQGDYEQNELVLLAQSSAHPLNIAAGARLKFGTGLIGKAFELGETVNVKDVTKDPMYLFKIPGVLSEVCVPIRIGDNSLGLLDAQAANVGEFTDDETMFLETVARLLAPSLQAAAAAVRK